MNNLKKLWLVTLLLLTALCTSAYEAEVDGIFYNFSGSSAIVTNNGPNSYRGNLDIPETVNYQGQVYTVTKLDERAIYNSTALLSINLPESITEIGDYAFEGCSGILSISIPGNVVSLGTGVFKGCEYLKTVTFNDGKELLQINEREWIFHVFNDCPVTTLYLGRNIRYYGSHSFVTSPRQIHYGLLWSDKLETLTIGKSVTEICYIAFAGCMNLKQIVIPSSVAFIDEGAFADCGINSLDIQNPLCQISDEAFWGCTSLKSAYINSKEIGAGAFDGCTDLEELTFGKDVSAIHDDAFMDCTNLKNVYSYATTPPSSSTSEFRYTVKNNWSIDWKPYNQNVYLYVPKNSIDAYREKEPWKSFKAIFAIPIQVETLKLSAHELNMNKQTEQTLSYVIEPLDADNKDVCWSSSDGQVAEVDANGNVKALNVGSAWIKVVAVGNVEAKDSCKVTVIQPVTEIKLNITSKTVKIGESFNLVATVQPSDADNKNVIWSSEDSNVASVVDGKVTALKTGVTRIYATSEADSHVSAYCTVTVSQPVTEIKLNITSKSVNVGESFNLVATVLPTDADNKNVIWSSDDNSIATVNNGKVTARKSGQTRIYATSEYDNNVYAYCTVTVSQPVTEIKLDITSKTVKVGESFNLVATVYPSDADNKNVVWTSENKDLATVNNGKVTALKPGVVRIYATSESDSRISAYCEVTITQPVTGISLNYSNYTLNFIGDVVQLEATVTPEDATNKEVNWKSSDEAVCIVSNGSVVAVGYGISVIIATTKDGGHMATCTIKVEDNTGIDTVDSAASDAFRVYTLDGKASSLSTKGIKLIKFSNGKTQKVVIK